MPKSKAKQIEVTLHRSPIGFEKSQGLTARALGLRKVGHSVVLPDNDSVRGMVFKIRHMVSVTTVTTVTEAESKTGETEKAE